MSDGNEQQEAMLVLTERLARSESQIAELQRSKLSAEAFAQLALEFELRIMTLVEEANGKAQSAIDGFSTIENDAAVIRAARAEIAGEA